MSGNKGIHDYPAGIKMESVKLFSEEGQTSLAIIKQLGMNDLLG